MEDFKVERSGTWRSDAKEVSGARVGTWGIVCVWLKPAEWLGGRQQRRLKKISSKC